MWGIQGTGSLIEIAIQDKNTIACEKLKTI